MIKAGAVTVVGITVNNGLKNIAIKNQNPTKTAVKPVLPPIAIPELDSTTVPRGETPKIELIIIPIESLIKALPILGILPSLFAKPAC
ncbi:Uncharacterised protein [Chlamydia trachomatis]|nr:Uncharacterised protein [Chlamydia trachomatis]